MLIGRLVWKAMSPLKIKKSLVYFFIGYECMDLARVVVQSCLDVTIKCQILYFYGLAASTL